MVNILLFVFGSTAMYNGMTMPKDEAEDEHFANIGKLYIIIAVALFGVLAWRNGLL